VGSSQEMLLPARYSNPDPAMSLLFRRVNLGESLARLCAWLTHCSLDSWCGTVEQAPPCSFFGSRGGEIFRRGGILLGGSRIAT
jgi:hypothetical protein